VLLGIVSLVAGGWFWWQVAAAEPEVFPLSAVTSEAAGTAGTAGSTAGEAGDDAGGPAEADESPGPGATMGSVVVHVAGAVKKTGVVRVSRGGRVHEAIAAAGGGTAAADLNRLNLAAVLEDGQKIYVPRRGEPVPPDAGQPGAQGSQSEATGAAGTGASSGTGTGGGADGSSAAGGSGSAAAAGKINLNTATAEELGNLPRVGPVLAQRIVDWRKEHGQFKTAEELDAVDGVGPKMLETLLPLVTV
jgi:competence protein ComEA